MKNIAVVTGASSGMGRGLALKIAQRYELDEIWLIARRKDRLLELAKEIYNAYHINCVIIPADLTKDDSFNKIVGRLEEVKPDIKILVNASGFGLMGESAKLSMSKQEEMIKLNVLALFSLTRICVEYMSKGSGIIQFASLAAYCPQPYLAVYGATKSFVLSYSVSLAHELKKYGIRVSIVCPGPVDTEFFDVMQIDKNSIKNIVKRLLMQNSEDVVSKTIKAFEKGRMRVDTRIITKFFSIVMGIPMQKLGSIIVAGLYKSLKL